MNYPFDVCGATGSAQNVPRRTFRKPHWHLYELLPSDICEMPVISVDGNKYLGFFVTDSSRYSHVVMLRKIIRHPSSIFWVTGRWLNYPFHSLLWSRLWISEQEVPVALHVKWHSTRTFRDCKDRGNGPSWTSDFHTCGKVRPMLLESTFPTTFWSFIFIQANFLYNQSPHSYGEHQTPFFVRRGLSQNYECLILFGYRVKVYVQNEKCGKLGNRTKPGIMPGCKPNSTELVVFDFVSSETFMAPSRVSFNLKKIPGIPEETLMNFLTRQKGAHVTKEDNDNTFLELLVSERNADKIFISKTEAVSLTMCETS